VRISAQRRAPPGDCFVAQWLPAAYGKLAGSTRTRWRVPAPTQRAPHLWEDMEARLAGNELFSSSLSERLSASRSYEVFGTPVTFTGTEKASWLQLRGGTLAGGQPWPNDLKDRAKGWPEHAFGTANAAVLVLWHRPGMGPEEASLGATWAPGFPTLAAYRTFTSRNGRAATPMPPGTTPRGSLPRAFAHWTSVIRGHTS
jgi:hypothetical protein